MIRRTIPLLIILAMGLDFFCVTAQSQHKGSDLDIIISPIIISTPEYQDGAPTITISRIKDPNATEASKEVPTAKLAKQSDQDRASKSPGIGIWSCLVAMLLTGFIIHKKIYRNCRR